MAKCKERVLEYLEKYCGKDIAIGAHVGHVSGTTHQAIQISFGNRLFAEVVWEKPDVPTFHFFGRDAQKYETIQRKIKLAEVEARLASGNYETRQSAEDTAQGGRVFCSYGGDW